MTPHQQPWESITPSPLLWPVCKPPLQACQAPSTSVLSQLHQLTYQPNSGVQEVRQDLDLVHRPPTILWARQGHPALRPRLGAGSRHPHGHQGRLPRLSPLRQRPRCRTPPRWLLERSERHCDSRRGLRWSNWLRADRFRFHIERC